VERNEQRQNTVDFPIEESFKGEVPVRGGVEGGEGGVLTGVD